MNKLSIALLMLSSSSVVMAADRQLFNANIGIQIQNSSDPLISAPAPGVLKDTLSSGLEFSIVGNVEFMHRFGGEYSDKYAVFANISTSRFGNDPRSYFGFEFLNTQNHSFDLGISNLGFEPGGSGFLKYGANYYFNHNNWLASAHFNQQLGESFEEGNGYWKLDFLVDKTIALPSLGNSELILGAGVSVLPEIYTNYHYELDKGAILGQASAQWLYPISEHWLLTSSLTHGLVGNELANSTKVDEDNMTQFSTGIRYVF